MKSARKSRNKNKSIDNAIPVVKEVKMKTKKTEKNKETAKKEKEKFGNEIDEIFKTVAKNKKELSTDIGTKKPKGEKGARRKEDSKKCDASSDGGGNIARRKTTDGIKIYSAEELRFNDPNAGGTPLCPFDCDCCF